MLKVITPMFTSKLQYAIEVFTEPSSILCTGRKENTILRDLQVLQNKAVRAALRRPHTDRSSATDLFEKTGQPSVREVSLRAVMRTARVYLGGTASDMAEGQIREHSHCRVRTRRENKVLPPQDSSSTLVASMAAVWNATPAEIKEETNQLRWKKQIKDFCASKVHKH
jgi:hypothetical protein